MPVRSLLHKSKVGELKEWLTANRVKWREVDHDWQIIQIRARQSNGYMGWIPIFDNIHSDHLTIPDALVALIATFVRENKIGNKD